MNLATTKPSWQPEPGHDETIEENWLFRLRRERFRSAHSDRTHDYYVMRLADAVHVIALTPDRRVVLVRQFRAGSGRDSLETPGGLVDKGEDPLVAGARELLEETGFSGDPPRFVSTVWSNPSILSSRLTTILITNAVRVREPNLDENEEVFVELVPAEEIPEMIRSGRIDHALAVAGLLWWLVGELPGPLALESKPVRRRPGLLTLMAGVAIAAGLLHLILTWRNIAAIWLQTVWGAASILGAIALWSLLPPPRATLVRAARVVERRFFFLLIVSPLVMVAWFLVLGGFFGAMLAVLEWLGLRVT